jgi:hypothetical protein
MATARKSAEKTEEPKDEKTVLESGWGPDSDERYDRVTVVSRFADGEPNHRPGFRLIAHEGATEEELRAAWNHPEGELPPEDVIDYIRRPQV